MPKKYNKRNLKGGEFSFNSLGKTFSDWGNSLKSNASSMWNKSKQNMGMNNSSYTSTTSPYASSSYTAPQLQPQSQPQSQYAGPSSQYAGPSSPYTSSSLDGNQGYSYGGSKKRRGKKIMRRKGTRRMRGGYKDNISLTNLASSAGPFSGATARAHNWVGGRKKKTMSRRK